jgi:hypothetical protein
MFTTQWYFCHDPDDGYVAWHATETDALADAAARLVLLEPEDGDEWDDGVHFLTVGRVTHVARQTNVLRPVGDLDEDGMDAEGEYWGESQDSRCHYEMQPLRVVRGGQRYYILVIDTEQYAGNFHRELTAWCTGVIEACGTGKAEAAQFSRDTGIEYIESVGVCDVASASIILPTPGWSTNGQGQHRRETSGGYPACLSVGILLATMPSPENVALLQQRALAYRPLSALDPPITVTGFRLLQHIETEETVAVYLVPEVQP